VSLSFQEKVFGQTYPTWTKPQMFRNLRHTAGGERLSWWEVKNEEDLGAALEDLFRAFDTAGLAFFASNDTTEKVVEHFLDPDNQLKWRPLAEWEVAVYRGEATLADKPVRDFSEERAFIARIQKKLDDEYEDAKRLGKPYPPPPG
jgi:hypothetical protein